MPEVLNVICGLPDDGRVRLTQMSPEVRFYYQGTAGFLDQLGDERPWRRAWVGPASPAATALAPGGIVNYIADPDLCSIALRAAITAAQTIPRPWFNHPLRIAASTRSRVSELLQGIDGLHAPRAIRFQPDAAQDIVRAIADAGLRYPVIVRRAGTHGGKTMARLDGPGDSLEANLYAGGPTYVTELVDFGDADGFHRKYRFAVIGGEPFVTSMIIGHDWNLHSKSRVWTPETIAEERILIDTFDHALRPRLKPITDLIYQRLGLDYFGVDCALRPDGSVLLFEANATMNILGTATLKPDLWSRTDKLAKEALLTLLEHPQRWAMSGAMAVV